MVNFQHEGTTGINIHTPAFISTDHRPNTPGTLMIKLIHTRMHSSVYRAFCSSTASSSPRIIPSWLTKHAPTWVKWMAYQSIHNFITHIGKGTKITLSDILWQMYFMSMQRMPKQASSPSSIYNKSSRKWHVLIKTTKK